MIKPKSGPYLLSNLVPQYVTVADLERVTRRIEALEKRYGNAVTSVTKPVTQRNADKQRAYRARKKAKANGS